MKESGWIIKLKAKEHFGMQKVMYILVILKLIKQMAMVFTHMLMVLGMKDSGSMMSKKVQEKRHGLMELSMSVNTKTVKNMDMVYTNGLTEVSSKETGKKTKLLVTVFTTGKMEEFTKAIGNKIICMVKVCISGLMEDNMKVSMLMIKKKVTEFTNIQTAVVIKVNGLMASNTEKELSLVLREYQGKVNGKMENVYTGLMK